MKKILLFFLTMIIAIVPAFATMGTINLIFDNGEIVEDNGNVYYDFDVLAFIDASGEDEVLGDGMVYVEYPTSIFGETMISYGKVTATKIGILDGEVSGIGIELYDLYDNDTFSDVFAITFDSPFMGTSAYAYFEIISDNPGEPSELLHIRMEVENYGSGTVFFPSDIPGTENLFHNLDYDTFDGGLDYSQATEPVEYIDPSGSLEYTSISAKWYKSKLMLLWSTKDETNLLGFVVKRSVENGSFETIDSYVTNPYLVAANTNNTNSYTYTDLEANTSTYYRYYVEAVDQIGNTFQSGIVYVDGSFIAYPNPFNPSFTVPFDLGMTQEVNIKLYDMRGRVVKDITNGTHAAGHYEYRVNCDDLSSGVYLLRTVVDGNASVQKMLYVK